MSIDQWNEDRLQDYLRNLDREDKPENDVDEPIKVDGLTIRTEYWRKPIPTKKYDWNAWADELDEDSPIGVGETEQQAIDDLKQQLELL